MKHGHVTGHKRERKPRQATMAAMEARGKDRAERLAKMTVEELLALAAGR